MPLEHPTESVLEEFGCQATHLTSRWCWLRSDIGFVDGWIITCTPPSDIPKAIWSLWEGCQAIQIIGPFCIEFTGLQMEENN